MRRVRPVSRPLYCKGEISPLLASPYYFWPSRLCASNQIFNVPLRQLQNFRPIRDSKAAFQDSVCILQIKSLIYSLEKCSHIKHNNASNLIILNLRWLISQGYSPRAILMFIMLKSSLYVVKSRGTIYTNLIKFGFTARACQARRISRSNIVNPIQPVTTLFQRRQSHVCTDRRKGLFHPECRASTTCCWDR